LSGSPKKIEVIGVIITRAVLEEGLRGTDKWR